MDSSFTFPRLQAAVPRPAPEPIPSQKPTEASQPKSRESNALRASVLNAALELGIGSNPLVADWMFNNALPEEEEEEDQISSPSLTYGSSATSEESAFTASSSSFSFPLPANQPGAGAHSGLRKDGLIRIAESDTDGANLDSKIGINTVSFPDFPVPSRSTTPSGTRKLKKKQKGDGYESDGGYMSEVGKKKDKKKADSKDGQVLPGAETEKEAKKRAKEEKKELLEEERKRKKSLLSAAKAAKKAEKETDHSKGYDTDGGGTSGGKALGKSKSKKSKTKTGSANTGGYETDAGYQSSTPTPTVKKSKSRFFKLSTKGSRPDVPVQAVPALPAPVPKEVVPLPIAERFATTLSPTTFSPTSPVQGLSTHLPAISLPSSKTENTSAPIPAPVFQPFGALSTPTAESAPPLPRVGPTSPISPIDRTSHVSSDSASSTGSNPKRHGGHFSPSRTGSSNGHGDGSGSFSTLTSQSHRDQGQPQPSPPASSSFPSSSQPAPPPGFGSLKLPTISYPLTRSPSPISPSLSTPPVAPLQIAKGLRMRPSLENMNYSSRNVSTSPISPLSPYPLGSPLRSAAPSPALSVVHPASHSRSPSPAQFPPRPRNPSADGFGHLPPQGQQNLSPNVLISPPNTAVESKPQKPTHLTIIPSYDYIVPSPSAVQHPNLPSPNVLAYYDIPPPSPPPMGPLPSVPPPPPGSSGGNTSNSNSKPAQFPSAAVLRQRVIDRTPRQLPPDHVAGLQNIQRGKESPFPARPVLPPMPNSGSIPGLESRVAANRYRDLYPQTPGSAAVEKSKPKETRRARFAEEPSWIEDDREDEDEDAYDGYEDEAGPEMRGVLDRFEDRSSESVDDHSGRALERSHSFEALKEKQPSLGSSKFYGARGTIRDSEYTVDDDGVTVADRNSRWTESVYSRNSILDEDASGQRRERLVRRVEEMLSTKAGGGVLIPPVPQLPETYTNMGMGGQGHGTGIRVEVTPGRSWNKF